MVRNHDSMRKMAPSGPQHGSVFGVNDPGVDMGPSIGQPVVVQTAPGTRLCFFDLRGRGMGGGGVRDTTNH